MISNVTPLKPTSRFLLIAGQISLSCVFFIDVYFGHLYYISLLQALFKIHYSSTIANHLEKQIKIQIKGSPAIFKDVKFS
jgi:hypothetical protein